MKLKGLVFVSLLLIPASVWASHGTDTKVESSGSDLFGSVTKKESGGSIDFYRDDSTRVGIDEDGASLRNSF